jgi:Mrp family chromosome partitioning ATPase
MEKKVSQRLASIKTRLAVMSGKGGVGKSTVAVNLAVSLAKRGFKVGIMDADIHGPNVPKMLGIEHKPPAGGPAGIIPPTNSDGVKAISMAFMLQNDDTPIAWRGPMKHGVVQQFMAEVLWGELDYLIVDLPPGTGDEPMSVAQILGPGLSTIIVTTPQDVALLDSRKSVLFAKSLGMEIMGIVENMSGLTCPHCNQIIDLFKTGGGEKAALELGIPFLGAIPIDPEVVQGGDKGTPALSTNGASPTSQAFKAITDLIVHT